MGQRLVITVEEKNEDVATIYFHWSGYTKSIYHELRDLIKMLDGKTINRTVLTENGFCEVESAKVEETDTVLKLIRLYESVGGGLSSDSYADFEKRYPGVEYKKFADRSNGLIDFTEKTMGEAKSWAEASATIDLDTREVFVEPFYFVDPEELKPDDVVTELKDDPTLFTFDEIEEQYKMICNIESAYVKYGTDMIYGIIE